MYNALLKFWDSLSCKGVSVDQLSLEVTVITDPYQPRIKVHFKMLLARDVILTPLWNIFILG